MTFYQFNQLPYETQFTAVFSFGTFLARRWQDEHEVVNLYALHSFFVEVSFDTAANELRGLRSFNGAQGLEDYAVRVRLPDWMAGA